jgi:hypothetical protein
MTRNELFARSRISEVDRRILAPSEASSPSVIRIRIEGMKGDQVARIINRVQEAASIDLEEGVAITVTERRIAIRRLPLSATSPTSAVGTQTYLVQQAKESCVGCSLTRN